MLLLDAQQKRYTLIDAQSQQQYDKQDSLSAVQFLDSLATHNYYFTKVISVAKKGDSTTIIFDKGKNYNAVKVRLATEWANQFYLETEFFTPNLDSLRKNIHQKLLEQGYSFSRLKTQYLGSEQEVPMVELSIYQDQQRKINGFVLKGYEKVPKRFVKNLEKEYQGKIYKNPNLLSLQKSLQNHPYIQLEKPPQTLFTKDSTDIYLFLKKKKSNSFDGVIGFGNDKSDKFTLNGTLDVQFRNMFNGFEAIQLYWQRNPDSGQNFDLKVDVPYVLGSNVGLNIQTNIYKQDSTFANFKFRPSVYYHLSNRQKLGLRGNFETSTVTQPLFLEGKDFNKQGVGLWYEYTEPTDIELFRYQSKIAAEVSYISAYYQSDDLRSKQYLTQLYLERNFKLIGNHYLNLRGDFNWLNSSLSLSTNEMLRFGGWNSLRGFNENSLLADLFYFGTAEYRYIIGKQAFFDIFGQYGQFNNKNIDYHSSVYSFGLGFNFFLPIGLMSFQISNGNSTGNPIQFKDTKIHWGILARF